MVHAAGPCLQAFRGRSIGRRACVMAFFFNCGRDGREAVEEVGGRLSHATAGVGGRTGSGLTDVCLLTACNNNDGGTGNHDGR